MAAKAQAAAYERDREARIAVSGDTFMKTAVYTHGSGGWQLE